ncbi:vesicle transport V-snare 13 [Blastocystis sp. ATCC 50177/Nand II]|uniref:Vesicle transport V-snare 13 n=1 Tax=Blastocystis sp. subtype 1 (strain ATCC 50177 / NandII) TaxID=478820 RepID=A0A196SM61_BLAHN|nr:vesicle transport V-snare 13 [Blastocystis sp. ATCC 50177/Nand II]
MTDMVDIYISEIKSNLRRCDELMAQGRTDNNLSFVKDCEKQLKEADDCFKQCDIETRMLPSSLKASIVQKVEALRKEYESKKRQLSNMKVQVERSELMGGGAASRELKRQMEDQVDMLERQNNTIEDATRTIFETGEVGLGTMTELQRQREVLTSASDKAKDTVSLSQQANTILNRMSKKFWKR